MWRATGVISLGRKEGGGRGIGLDRLFLFEFIGKIGEGGGGGGGGEDASVPQRTLESLSQVDRSSNGFFFGDGWDLKRIVLQEG